MGIRIAIDTGGTFTDLVLFDASSKRLVFHKVASTPDDPSRALVDGVAQILEKAGGDKRDVTLLVHGTTVATNAVLQRRGAKTALITTAGFRDVLQIQRQDRPRMYDLRSRRAEALIPRSLRYEVSERIRFDGSEQLPIDREGLKQIIARLKEQGVEAVAVGLLHSYANGDHERQVGRVLREELPAAKVCLSHELVQEHGEYERFSTCAMNAYIQPVMETYLDRLERLLVKSGLSAPVFVMKSNGGVMSAGEAGRRCVETILSGPAGGVVAGAAIAGIQESRNLITADMGGTSFDVSVIHEGRAAFARDAEMAGLALKVPMLDIHTVGAGGGSVGWIDGGGALRVGPRSAGAVPGPACYGLGGDEPTVTDANLVLGRLALDTLLGGGLVMNPDAARHAILEKIARPLGLSVEQAAEGMVRVVNGTMTAAIRKLTVERGYDPRRFTLCAFGGAGPLHAAELADEMGAKDVLVPLAPGVTSAVGLLMSNLCEDRVRTEIRLLEDVDPQHLAGILTELEDDARRRLQSAKDGHATRAARRLGLRYLGQGYDLPVAVNGAAVDIPKIAESFHQEHARRYGFARRDQPVEMVNVWVSVEADMGRIELPKAGLGSHPPDPTVTRDVYFRGQPFDTPVFRRESLRAGTRMTGPAIIEQLDSTTVVWPKQHMTVDMYGQLILSPMPR